MPTTSTGDGSCDIATSANNNMIRERRQRPAAPTAAAHAAASRQYSVGSQRLQSAVDGDMNDAVSGGGGGGVPAHRNGNGNGNRGEDFATPSCSPTTTPATASKLPRPNNWHRQHLYYAKTPANWLARLKRSPAPTKALAALLLVSLSGWVLLISNSPAPSIQLIFDTTSSKNGYYNNNNFRRVVSTYPERIVPRRASLVGTRTTVSDEGQRESTNANNETQRQQHQRPRKRKIKYPMAYEEYFEDYLQDSREFRHRTDPIETKDCIPQYEWQTSVRPTCNTVHEVADLTTFYAATSSGTGYGGVGGSNSISNISSISGNVDDHDDELVRLIANGYWRDVWIVKDDYRRQKRVVKTLRYEHAVNDRNYDRNRRDASTYTQYNVAISEEYTIVIAS